MGRGKIELKRIESDLKKQLTFCKRKNGLMKKASELSILCDAEIALIVFSSRGRLYEFANKDIGETIERYEKVFASCDNVDTSNAERSTTQEMNTQFYEQELNKLKDQRQVLLNFNRMLMGEGLSELNVKELNQLENRLEESIAKIRTQKHEIILAETKRSKKRARHLEKENADLKAKIAKAERIQGFNVMVDPAQEHNYQFQAYQAQNMIKDEVKEEYGVSVTTYHHQDSNNETQIHLD